MKPRRVVAWHGPFEPLLGLSPIYTEDFLWVKIQLSDFRNSRFSSPFSDLAGNLVDQKFLDPLVNLILFI